MVHVIKHINLRAAGGFTGSVKDFVAAGDSVLLRIKHHMNDGLHLSETWDLRFW